MSVGEMDEYVSQLSPNPIELESQTLSDDTKGDTINIQPVTQTSPSPLLFSANAQMSSIKETHLPTLSDFYEGSISLYGDCPLR